MLTDQRIGLPDVNDGFVDPAQIEQYFGKMTLRYDERGAVGDRSAQFDAAR